MGCPNCGDPNFVSGKTCIQCGYRFRVGSKSKKVTGSSKTTEPLEALKALLAGRAFCPRCQRKTFDGWRCRGHACGYKIKKERKKRFS